MSAKEHWRTREVDEYYFGVTQHTELLLWLVARLAPEKIFEFGCGTGRHLNEIKLSYGDTIFAVGCDISEKMIRLGRERFKTNIDSLWVGDETDLDMVNSSFYDMVFTVSVLDHIEYDVVAVLRKLLRITKKHLVLVEPFCGFSGCAYPEYTTEPHTYSWDYSDLLSQLPVRILDHIPVPLPHEEGKKSMSKYYHCWVCQKEEV